MRYVKTFNIGTAKGLDDSMKYLDGLVNKFVEESNAVIVDIKDQIHPKPSRSGCPEIISRVLIYEAMSDSNVLNQEIDKQHLSTRIRGFLTIARIETYGQLVKCSEKQLLDYKNFGCGSLRKLKNHLAEKGLSLRS